MATNTFIADEAGKHQLLCVSLKPVYMGAAGRLPPGTREAPVTENTDITPKTS